ncbi:hypothetical protein B0H14DRAFT_916103 [Mycena olivaceomarginata]|nr:hypothetical protein B0H14DRAFT_916103 [Mycena olivaceomarginata]
MRFCVGLAAIAQVSYAAFVPLQTTSVSVQTTSGLLQGTASNGLSIFKGVRFGQAPIGSPRWAAPVAFTTTASQNATTQGPACIQQFPLRWCRCQ